MALKKPPEGLFDIILLGGGGGMTEAVSDSIDKVEESETLTRAPAERLDLALDR